MHFSAIYYLMIFCTGLFDDGRFVIAISKYDQFFTMNTNRLKYRQERENPVTTEFLQQTTQSFIHSSVGVKPPSDIVVPVSAQWAESAYDLRDDPDDEKQRQIVKEILSLHPEQQPQGQGEAKMSSLNMATGLERISGVSQLEDRCSNCMLAAHTIRDHFPFRLRCIIQRCIEIWQTSLATAYRGYLNIAKQALLQYHKQQETESKG